MGLVATDIGIDLDRPGGWLCTRGANQIYVYMPFQDIGDGKGPGYYFNEHGKEVPEAVAALAGMDVEKWAKERKRAERLAAVKATIDAELEIEADPSNQKVVKEAGEFKMIDLGTGNFNIVDVDGEKLNPIPLSKVMADKTWLALTANIAKAPKGPGVKALA